jgi:hypothetical protein
MYEQMHIVTLLLTICYDQTCMREHVWTFWHVLMFDYFVAIGHMLRGFAGQGACLEL